MNSSGVLQIDSHRILIYTVLKVSTARSAESSSIVLEFGQMQSSRDAFF